MNGLAFVDYVVVAGYFAALIGVAVYFSRQQTTTEVYYVGSRSIPWWAMGISLMATLISSITFVAYPGDAYEKNWSGLVPGLMVPLVLLLMAAVVIPFYRQAVGLSAYEYFEKRFGYGARVYSSLAFLLMQFSKMSMVLWLISLAVSSMGNWNIYVVLIVLEAITITYVVLGGIEAVIWTAVLQGIVLAVGGLLCLAVLLFRPEGGPAAVLELAWQNDKFSLGGFGIDLSQPTFLVLALYGISVYIQKYATDQSVVQRYLVAKSNREALHGTLLGALLCIPVWAMFLLIGSCLWSYCRITGMTFPPHIDRPDEIFPYFIIQGLPAGLSGLVLAALIATAIDADLNSMSVVIVEDYYRRLRPNATDAERLFIGKLMVVATGIGTIGMAALLARTEGTALSTAFLIASIVSGGVTGLFALAFLCPRATAGGAYAGIVAGVLFTAWATLSSKGWVDFVGVRYTLHPYLIGVFTTLLLFIVGYVTSPLFCGAADARSLTIWGWLSKRRAPVAAVEN
jgi:SSS family solute:Na+ symporter